MTTRTGAELIAEERERQVTEGDWSAHHDDSHTNHELVLAAICYAAPERIYVLKEYGQNFHFVDPWPWDFRFDKRPRKKGTGIILSHPPDDETYKRLLVKAGALIAAEIDRLHRASAGQRKKKP